MTQAERDKLEIQNLFSDNKSARKIWERVGQRIAALPAAKPVIRVDKDGNQTPESQFETQTFSELKTALGDPTLMEMQLYSQAKLGCFNPSAFVAFRDTTGGKPIDETKNEQLIKNPYENFSLEELEEFKAYLENKKVKELEHAQTEPKELLETNEGNS